MNQQQQKQQNYSLVYDDYYEPQNNSPPKKPPPIQQSQFSNIYRKFRLQSPNHNYYSIQEDSVTKYTSQEVPLPSVIQQSNAQYLPSKQLHQNISKQIQFLTLQPQNTPTLLHQQKIIQPVIQKKSVSIQTFQILPEHINQVLQIKSNKTQSAKKSKILQVKQSIQHTNTQVQKSEKNQKLYTYSQPPKHLIRGLLPKRLNRIVSRPQYNIFLIQKNYSRSPPRMLKQKLKRTKTVKEISNLVRGFSQQKYSDLKFLFKLQQKQIWMQNQRLSREIRYMNRKYDRIIRNKEYKRQQKMQIKQLVMMQKRTSIGYEQKIIKQIMNYRSMINKRQKQVKELEGLIRKKDKNFNEGMLYKYMEVSEIKSEIANCIIQIEKNEKILNKIDTKYEVLNRHMDDLLFKIESKQQMLQNYQKLNWIYLYKKDTINTHRRTYQKQLISLEKQKQQITLQLDHIIKKYVEIDKLTLNYDNLNKQLLEKHGIYDNNHNSKYIQQSTVMNTLKLLTQSHLIENIQIPIQFPTRQIQKLIINNNNYENQPIVNSSFDSVFTPSNHKKKYKHYEHIKSKLNKQQWNKQVQNDSEFKLPQIVVANKRVQLQKYLNSSKLNDEIMQSNMGKSGRIRPYLIYNN